MKKQIYYVLSFLLVLSPLMFALPKISKASIEDSDNKISLLSDDNDTNSISQTPKPTKNENRNIESSDKNEAENDIEDENELENESEDATAEGELNNEKRIHNILDLIQKKLEGDDANEVQQSNEDQAKSQERINELLSQMQARPGFLKFILGPDYKNAGEVRSELVILRSRIKQLTQLREKVTDPETQKLIDDAVAQLNQEANKLETTLSQELSGFSLFGWLVKLLNPSS